MQQSKQPAIALRGLLHPLLGLVLALTAGCRSFGPGTVAYDRYNYSTSIADSWKQQTLLNIVKLRYIDLPIWLDVGQVVSGYSLETTGNAGGQLSSANAIQGNSLLFGASGKFTDRPTITYVPLTGENFLEGFMAPVTPSKIFYLIQSGYAADFILELSVDSLNGLHNRPASLASKRRADPEFFRVLALMREIQDAGAVGMNIEAPTNGRPAAVIFFRSDKPDPELLPKMKELRQLLGLAPDAEKFRLVNSPVRTGPDDLAVCSRSLMQIMMALATGVEVPPDHRKRNLTPPIAEIPADVKPLMRVHSGAKKPPDVFTSIQYEGAWFWIANDDWKTKRTFTSIMFLFSLADTGGGEKLPTITIPAQ